MSRLQGIHTSSAYTNVLRFCPEGFVTDLRLDRVGALSLTSLPLTISCIIII